MLPDPEQILTWIAFGLFRCGLPQVGISVVRAATWFTRNEDVWLLRAELERHIDSESYEAVLRQGLKRNPASVGLRASLGRELLNSGRTSEGRMLIDAARETDPSRPEPELASASGAVAERDFEAAKDSCRLAEQKIEAALLPRVEWFEDLAAIVIDIPGEREWVERILRRALADWPQSSWANLMMGALLSRSAGDASAKHLRRARRHWLAPKSVFDRNVRLANEALARQSSQRETNPHGEEGSN